MAEVVSKIKKLRTFSEDVILARGKSSPASAPTPSPTPTAPATVARQVRERKAVVTVLPPKTTTDKISPPSVSRFDGTLKQPAPSLMTVPAIQHPLRAATKPPITVPPSPIGEEKSAKLAVDVAAISKPAPSILASSLRNVDVMEDYRNETAGGSIITDRKRDRFRLFPATWQAITDWISSERTAWKEAKEQERAALPKVQAVEKREEVLKKAAVASALAPKDDHVQVMSRLPMEKPTEAKPPPVIEIKSKEEVPEPSWSHYKGNVTDVSANTAVDAAKVTSNEISTPLPPPPVIASSPVSSTTTTKDTEKKGRSFLMRHFIADKTSAPATKAPENVSPLKVAAVPEKSAAITGTPAIETKPPVVVSTPTQPEKTEPTPKITATPVALAEPESVPVTDASPITRPEPATAEVKTAVPTRVDRIPPIEATKPNEPKSESGDTLKTSNAVVGRRFAPARPATFPIWRVSLIATTSILLGVSAALWFFGGDGNDEPATLADRQPGVELVQADSKAAVSVGNNRHDFLSKITEAKTSSSKSIALIEPTVDLAGEVTPINTASILEVLDLRAPANFVRAIEAINFGRYDDSPFLVLKVTSFDISFSGLLQSEMSIIADLAPFFGTPVVGTFDPQSRLENSVSSPFFVDEVIKNHDVRILRDETRNERLVYGFVNRNTVVIAADSATFAAVANKIK